MDPFCLLPDSEDRISHTDRVNLQPSHIILGMKYINIILFPPDLRAKARNPSPPARYRIQDFQMFQSPNWPVMRIILVKHDCVQLYRLPFQIAASTCAAAQIAVAIPS